MARAVFVTYLIALAICSTAAYSKQCAVGPAYWCQSFQNAQDCGALRHCTDTVWRYDEKHAKVETSTSCEWCEKILENTHKGIQHLANNEDLIKSTLTDACKLLPQEDISSKCLAVVEKHTTAVLSLMKHERYNTLCHLMDICPHESTSSEATTEKMPIDEQSKMLCNVIVRATHELHANQHKDRSQVQLFLKNDCQKLATTDLVQKCDNLVDRHGHDIFAHVASNVELSKVCEYLDDFVDPSAVSTVPHVHCELCSFVMSTGKYMLDAKQSEESVLGYIDEQVCSRLLGEAKKHCKEMVGNKGKEVIEGIRSGTQPMLLCSHFQVCLDQIIDPASPIQKDEMRSFFVENMCDKLGSFKGACRAMIEQDSARLLKALTNEIDGNDLCHMFGLCPKKTPLIESFNLKDDPVKCQRCMKDFARRKHIAERLVNHSSEFLNHLCGQLPAKDDCTKAVDDSINELLTFIRSLDPKDICVQLNMCDELTMEQAPKMSSDSVINEEILEYIKIDVCPKLGELSAWCVQLVDSEGLALLKSMEKTIDPHRICQIIDVCPLSAFMSDCQDKCQCCTDKVEMYQIKLAKFLQTIVASTRMMCDRMPNHDVCSQMADLFQSNVNQVIARFNSKSICQMLSVCSASQEVSTKDQCQTCKTEVNLRENRFRTIISEMTTGLLASCTDNQCRSQVQSAQQQTLSQVDKVDSQGLCRNLGYCTMDVTLETSPIQQRLRHLLQNQMKNLDQRLESSNICSQFDEMKPMCDHLMASPLSQRYAHVYLALLKDNPKLVDDDVRAHLATKPTVDICTACKNAVQSSKDFWTNSLEIARDTMLQACERCPKKDECRAFYNKRYDNIEAYVSSIDGEQMCQSLRLCSSSSSALTSDQCSTCVQRLQTRKESARLAVDRVASYADDLCQRFAPKQCQTFVQQIKLSAEQAVDRFDPKETCTRIGFCSATGVTESMDFGVFEKHMEDELDKTVCSKLGPFQSLCEQVIRGNHKQIQTLKINYNIRDLMQVGESRALNLFSASKANECAKDKCQCCIDRVDAKKTCTKNLADKVFGVMIKTCDYCPSKDQCRQFWKDAQTCVDTNIDDIDSKSVCTRFGFCSASSLCSQMGVFQGACEQALSAFTQTFQNDQATLEQHLPHTSVVVLPLKSSESGEKVEEKDSNSTCVLCEYMMHILSNYIHSASTAEEIEESLKKVCQQMPGTLQKQCDELVENYGAVVIATLVREFDVSSVCRKLNLCTSTMKVNVSHLTQANAGACGVCDYVSTYVNFALKRDSSETSLGRALSGVCGHLASDQQSQCETIVALFAPHIRELQMNLGDNFCQKLAMCQSSGDVPKPVPAKTMPNRRPLVRLPLRKSESASGDDTEKRTMMRNLDDTPQCTLCHYVITYLDAVLKNNKSAEAIETALEKVCTILPRKERSTCDEFVKTYGPVLAELVSELADPDAICRYLGVCQVTEPLEATTKKSAINTYDNHDYMHLPVQNTPFTCTICQYVITRMKHYITLNQTEEEILASLKKSCDLFSVLDLQQQCRDFLDKYESYLIQMISSDVEPKVACQSIGICQKETQVVSSTLRPQSTRAPLPPSTTYGKCVFGMSYWCTSRQNAVLCNAVELCERQVWSKKNKRIII